MLDFSRPPDVLGEEPSAAQNGSVIKTCTQCGAINKAQVYLCCFCDAPLTPANDASDIRARVLHAGTPAPGTRVLHEDWKRELENRVEAYRTRRKRLHPNTGQGALAFDASGEQENTAPRRYGSGGKFDTQVSLSPSAQLAFDEPEVGDPAEATEEFAFAIGIGPRPQSDREYSGASGSCRVEIDLTQPPLPPVAAPAENGNAERDPQITAARSVGSPYFPLAPIKERSVAGFIDAIFLLFAYGGFLTLFGSLGGHFSFSKFSTVVYAATLALFYVQYFALFTIFGGVTPGMMLRRLDLVNFDGEVPTPRQLLQRSFGYMVSGATFLLGFCWAFWDEDHLTWQDRISSTYLTSAAGLLAVDNRSSLDASGLAQK